MKCGVNCFCQKTSRVTRVTLVLLIGNETLRESSSRFGNCVHALPSVCPIVWSPYRITSIHWLMVRRRSWRTHVASLYGRIYSSDFSAEKIPIGSVRSLVSLPIKRTRVTRVTQDVLYHRFTYAAWKLFTLWERYTKHAKLKTLPTWSNNEPTTYGRFKQTGSENLEPYQSQGCKTWQRCVERTILPQHKYPPGVPL